MTELKDPAANANADDSYESSDVVNPDEAVAEAAERLGLTDVTSAGSGLEFVVYRAWSPADGAVAVRVPRYRDYRFPGRKPFSALRSLEQERIIAAHLHPLGFPVAEPIVTMVTTAAPVLVSRFLESERHGADSRQVGALLARLHQVPVPDGLDPLDHDGHPLAEALARRLARRWEQLREYLPKLPATPGVERLTGGLTPVQEPASLLHLDIRACNLMSAHDRIVGWVDWTCAMVGHPALELARVAEYAQLPENGISEADVLAGYAEHAPLPHLEPTVEALVRLDTILMLGVIFYAYAPDLTRQEWIADRLRELIPACRL